MPERLPGFQNIQAGFAAHIRDPIGVSCPPDVPAQRMAAYRDLFFNNIESFIATGFPVLKGVMDEDSWRSLIRDFYRDHHCRSPLFIEIAEEFLTYLTNERPEISIDPPFLRELAHYDWVELALAVSESEPPEFLEISSTDYLDSCFVLSSVAWPLAYQFPVHKIGPEFRPEKAGADPTFLVVYRDREDRVRFMEINQGSYQLLQLMSEAPERTLREHLLPIAQALQHPNPEGVLEFGVDLVSHLHRKGVVGLSK